MRLFVAVEIPHALRAPLLDVAARVGTSGWRFSPAAQTVRFLGSLDDDARVDDVRARLAHAAARCAPFVIDVAGAGTFGKKRAPHVLWAGVRHSDGLDDGLDGLARAVDDALDPLLGPRDRPFRAHVTLGRARGGGRVDDEAMRGVGVIGRAPVDEIVLFDSKTGGSAAVHTPIGRWPLAGAG
jgi:RNA 2',3'-cyclic 3'-phosphodiesterase